MWDGVEISSFQLVIVFPLFILSAEKGVLFGRLEFAGAVFVLLLRHTAAVPQM